MTESKPIVMSIHDSFYRCYRGFKLLPAKLTAEFQYKLMAKNMIFELFSLI